ncbi:hypothetical protein QQS21_000987 [Conoideocrella luteorostrata]|uniref:Mid2 domain-containing protein n=1 Tax=Conoideocrella luteorostrata TaxID=1105319 RepID=A0AAJ0D0Q7_9HYPO|nr:hypothetical protein QQS21_000987 [Conoideocrella luteorostrata]
MIPACFLVVTLAGLAWTSALESSLPSTHFEAASLNALAGLALPDSFNGLSARANECLVTEDACGTGFCMPKGSTCCTGTAGAGTGTYCNIGYSCYAQGCCPIGKVCSGTPTGGCSTGKRQCGSVCIPSTSACCSPGSSTSKWCDYPKKCGANGVCVSRTTLTTSTSEPSSTTASETASASSGSSAQATGNTGSDRDGSDNGNSNNNNDNNNNQGKRTPVGAIVGGVIGGIAGLALIAVGVLLLLRHKKKQQDAANQASGFPQQQPPPPHQSMPPMQQQQQQQYQPYPQQPSPYMHNTSPAQGMGYPPPQGSPPPQGYYNAYQPSMGTDKVSSPTGTYVTDPRSGAPTLSPAPGFAATSTPPPPSVGAGGTVPQVHPGAH